MSVVRRRRLGVRIAQIQRLTGLPYESVLRDHALSYMLAGIASVPELAALVLFKGGTALRKCYFPGYRYSEDLDFSSRDLHAWTSEQMVDLLQAACEAARVLAEAIESPYTFTPRIERHREDRSRSQQDARITVGFPTGASLPIKFELTQTEPVVRPVEVRSLIHEFDDELLDITVPVYGLDEVTLEKLRAFLQTAVNLERRDWTNRARDLYDLWWLWSHDAKVAWSELREPLHIKAKARGVNFSRAEDFLDPRVIGSYRQIWSTQLRNVVPELPPFDDACG